MQETQVLNRICKNKFTLSHIPSEIAESPKSENLKRNQRAECMYGTIHYKHSKFILIATLDIK